VRGVYHCFHHHCHRLYCRHCCHFCLMVEVEDVEKKAFAVTLVEEVTTQVEVGVARAVP